MKKYVIIGILLLLLFGIFILKFNIKENNNGKIINNVIKDTIQNVIKHDTNQLQLTNEKFHKNNIDIINDSILKIFEKNPDTKELDLTSRNLKNIPSSVFKFKKLEKLFLDYNQLRTFPKEIYQLKELKKISVTYNYIESFSNAFFSLSNLKVIDLLGNKVDTIDNRFCKLHNLEYINLTGNYLKEIDSCFISLTKLRFLGIGNWDYDTVLITKEKLIYLKENMPNLKIYK